MEGEGERGREGEGEARKGGRERGSSCKVTMWLII